MINKSASFFFFTLLAVCLVSQGEAALNANLSTRCLHDYFYDPVFENCTKICQPGYYGDFSTGTCSVCDPTCYSCTGPSKLQCVECRAPYSYRFQNSSGISCLSACSDANASYYEYLGSVCGKCGESSHFVDSLLGTDTCVDSQGGGCPYDTTSNMFCYQTPAECLWASSDSKSSCTGCTEGYTMLPISRDLAGVTYGQCHPKLAQQRYNLPITLDSSVDSYVYCQANCTTCTANRTCLTCSNGKKSFGGYCILDACPTDATQNQDSCDCPAGYFADPISLQCLKCDPSCKTCFGPAPYQCFDCSDGYLLHQDTTVCEKSCDTGYYMSEKGECLSCDAQCYNCTSEGSYSCGLCSTFSYLSNLTTANEYSETQFPGCAQYQCYDYMEFNSTYYNCTALATPVPKYSGLIVVGTDVNCRQGYAFDATRNDCVSNCSEGYTYGGFMPSANLGTVAYVCGEKNVVTFNVASTDDPTVFQVSCSDAIKYLAFRARSWFRLYYKGVQLEDSMYSFDYIDDQTLLLTILVPFFDTSEGSFEIILPDNYQTSIYTPYVVKGTSFSIIPSKISFARATGNATQIAGTVMTVAVLIETIVNYGSTAAIRVAFIMELLQFYRYVNVSYPEIVMTLFNSTFELPVNFQIQLGSSDSSFEEKLEAWKAETVDPPGKFLLYEDSAYFIDNCGDTAFTLLLVLFAWKILKFALHCLRKSNSKKLKNYVMLGYRIVHWNFFFNTLLSNYQPIALYAFVQMTSPDNQETYGILCLVLLSIFVIVLAATPVLILMVNEVYFKFRKENPASDEPENTESVGNEMKPTLTNFEHHSREVSRNQQPSSLNQLTLNDSRREPRNTNQKADNPPEQILKTEEVSLNIADSSATQTELNAISRGNLAESMKDRKRKEGSCSEVENNTENQKGQQPETASSLDDLPKESSSKDIKTPDSIEGGKTNSSKSLEPVKKLSDYQIKKEKSEKKDEEELPGDLGNYKLFFEEFKNEKRSQLLFLPVFMLRGVVFVGALAFGQGNGLGQAIVIMIANTAFFAYFVIIRPYEEKLQNIFMIVNELIVFIVGILVLGIGAYEKTSAPDPKILDDLGLAIVICNFILILINLISTLIETCDTAISVYKAVRDYCRKRMANKKDLKQKKVAESDQEANKPPKLSVLVKIPIKPQKSKSKDAKTPTKPKSPKKKKVEYFERVETEAAGKFNMSSKIIIDPLSLTSFNNVEEYQNSRAQKKDKDTIGSEKSQEIHEVSLDLSTTEEAKNQNIKVRTQVISSHNYLFNDKGNPKQL